MKRTLIISLIVFLVVSTLSACGGGGGGGADPDAPATVDVIPSKTIALATGSDMVTVQADVRKADGTAVADGTEVAFSVSTAVLSAPSAATTNGIASVTMTCAAVPGANNYSAVITAAAGEISGTKSVKFINQPAKVDVSIAFSPAVTNLAALDLTLNNTVGATFDNASQLITPVNAAEGSFVVGNSVANSTRINFINAAGFNSGTTPIIKATFAVAAGAGLPQFSVSSTAAITAADKDGIAVVPQVSAANMVVTTKFDTE